VVCLHILFYIMIGRVLTPRCAVLRGEVSWLLPLRPIVLGVCNDPFFVLIEGTSQRTGELGRVEVLKGREGKGREGKGEKRCRDRVLRGLDVRQKSASRTTCVMPEQTEYMETWNNKWETSLNVSWHGSTVGRRSESEVGGKEYENVRDSLESHGRCWLQCSCRR